MFSSWNSVIGCLEFQQIHRPGFINCDSFCSFLSAHESKRPWGFVGMILPLKTSRCGFGIKFGGNKVWNKVLLPHCCDPAANITKWINAQTSVAFFVSSEYESMKLMKLGYCLSMLVLQLLPVNQPRPSLQCPHPGRFSWLWIHLSKSWVCFLSFWWQILPFYVSVPIESVLGDGWCCQESVSGLKIASKPHILNLGGFICVGCCPQRSLQCHFPVGIVLCWDSPLALCNSRSFLCSQNVFK